MVDQKIIKRNSEPGVGFKIVGAIGILVSIAVGVVYDYSLSQLTLYSRNPTAAHLLNYLIGTVIFGMFFFGILLSIIIIGLGCLLRSLKE